MTSTDERAIIHYPALASAYTTMRPGRRTDMILLHATGGVKAGDLYTLSGRDRRQLVSVHYYITKIGEMYQLVQDKDIAWHAGVSFWQGEEDCNRFSIGIELENLNNGRDTYPQAQVDAALWLVRNKVQHYKVPRSRLVRHAQVALPPGRKSDPRGFPWDTFVQQVYALPVTAQRYVVRENGTNLRTGPSTKTVIADFGDGPVMLPEGRVVEVHEVVMGEYISQRVSGDIVATNRWGRWVEDGRSNGFLWMGLLQALHEDA